jgi:hypothetical protein
MMKRKIMAALAFNAYAFMGVLAFWAATPYLFEGKEQRALESQGLTFNAADWGFSDHYIWRLFAAVISTLFAGFICGAIARKKGGVVALWANTPSVVGWIVYAGMWFYFFDILEIKVDDKINNLKNAYCIVSIIAIPATCWLAMKAGQLGELFQANLFHQNKTLGISEWHWVWICFPFNIFFEKIIYNIWVLIFGIKYVSSLLQIKATLISSFLFMLGLAVVALYVFSLILSYQILAGRRYQDKTPTQRGALVAAILVGGYFLAFALQSVFWWCFDKTRF